MKAIIVATNFSKTSENAILYSASLAQLFKSKLVIFNAFKLPLHASNSLITVEGMQKLINKTNDKLKEKAIQLAKEYNIKVEYKCSYVDFDREIDSLMMQYNAMFLVMGMSEKSMEQNLLGNPTTTIISMKKFPVLAVPVHAKFSGIDKILFACDLMEKIPLKTLAKLKNIATQLNSEINLFYVNKKIEELQIEEKKLKNINKELEGVTYYYKKVNSESVIKAIEEEIIKSSPDILVMVPKKYGFWESLIHKSKTRVMAAGLNIPLFSIPIE